MYSFLLFLRSGILSLFLTKEEEKKRREKEEKRERRERKSKGRRKMGVDAVAVVFGVSGTIGMVSSMALLALSLYQLVYHYGRRRFATYFVNVLVLNLALADLLTGLRSEEHT